MSSRWRQNGCCGFSYSYIVSRYMLHVSIFYLGHNQANYIKHKLLVSYLNIQYSLTHSWSWALLEKPKIVQLHKNFPALNGIRRFITAFARALHWSLSWTRKIHTITSHLSKIKFNTIRLPTSWSSQWSRSFWLSYMHSSSPPSCYMLCPSHPTWLDHSDYIWRREQVIKLLIMQFSPTSCHFISLPWSH
jgi:hypothetical protein